MAIRVLQKSSNKLCPPADTWLLMIVASADEISTPNQHALRFTTGPDAVRHQPASLMERVAGSAARRSTRSQRSQSGRMLQVGSLRCACGRR